jgi:hypothetical protein
MRSFEIVRDEREPIPPPSRAKAPKPKPLVVAAAVDDVAFLIAQSVGEDDLVAGTGWPDVKVL